LPVRYATRSALSSVETKATPYWLTVLMYSFLLASLCLRKSTRASSWYGSPLPF